MRCRPRVLRSGRRSQHLGGRRERREVGPSAAAAPRLEVVGVSTPPLCGRLSAPDNHSPSINRIHSSTGVFTAKEMVSNTLAPADSPTQPFRQTLEQRRDPLDFLAVPTRPTPAASRSPGLHQPNGLRPFPCWRARQSPRACPSRQAPFRRALSPQGLGPAS